MRSPAKINKAIFFLALWMIAANLVAGIIAENFGLGAIVGTGIYQIVGLFVPFLFYLLVTKQNHRKVLAWKPLSLKNGLVVLALSVALLPMLQVVARIASFVFTPALMDIVEDVSITPIWLTFIIIAILPSFFEEFWFRGAMYTKYREGGVSIRKTAIITGIFFGLMHLNFHQAIYAAVMGFVYAYLLYYTRSIWAPIIGHIINNGIHALLLYSEPYMDWMASFDDRAGMFLLIMGIASLVMLPVLILSIRHFKKYHAVTQDQKPKEPVAEEEATAEESPQSGIKAKVYTWGFWAAVTVFVLVAILMEFALRIM